MSETSISTSTSPFVSSRLLSEVGRFIRDRGLIREADRVLCLVSGGADSVAMLRLLHALSEGADPAFTHGFSLGICHVNYGLRGSYSDGDESFVRELGDELGLTVHAIRAPVEKRQNFQAWARDFRYLAAQNLCRWQGYTRIAVGHNKDDRVETLLYRMITYSGRRSLAVMPPRRGRVIRPLLILYGSQIRSFCAEGGIAWREDASNSSTDYARNQIRHTVIPRLAEIRPDFRERMLDTLALLEDEDAVLETVTEEAWELASSGSEDGVLRAPVVAGLPRATARLVVRRWLSAASRQVRLSRRLLDAVVDLCDEARGSRGVSLSEGLRAERQYDRLVLTGSETPVGESVILPVPGRVIFGDYEIEAVESPSWPLVTADSSRATICADSLNLPLVVRRHRPGDRFTPLGFTGRKSIQDLLVDEKVPRRQRPGTPIITDGSEIVWVGGLRVADRFRVTGDSRRVIGIRIDRREINNRV